MNFLVSMIEFKSKLSEKFDRLQKYLDWKDEKKVEKYKS